MADANSGRMTAEAVVDLYESFTGAGVDTWIDGGWAVDALLGQQTRDHADLDLVVPADDLPRLRALLLERGYRDKGEAGATPWNYVMSDAGGLEVDLHVITLDAEGDGVLGPPEKGNVYPAHSLTGRGAIHGRQVRCIAAEDLVAFHTGYRLDEDDCADVIALCTRFGIQIPAEVAAAHDRLSRAGAPRRDSAPPA